MLSPTAMCECALVSHASFCASLCPRPACVPRQAERQKPHVSFRWRDPTEIPRCSMCVYGALGIYNIGQSKGGRWEQIGFASRTSRAPGASLTFPGWDFTSNTARCESERATPHVESESVAGGCYCHLGGEGKKEKGKGSVLMFGLSGNVCQFSL